MAYASPEQRHEMSMEAGVTYEVVVEGISRDQDQMPIDYTGELYRDEIMDGARLGFMEEVQVDLLQEAVDLARESDVVVMVVGKNTEWESEAYDMKTMDLPGDQDNLIQKVLRANPNTVIVNQSGTPINMPWISEATTLVQVKHNISLSEEYYLTISSRHGIRVKNLVTLCLTSLLAKYAQVASFL